MISPLRLPCYLSWQRIRLQSRRPGFNPWIGKIPWRRAWQPTPIFLPGEEPDRLQSMRSQRVEHDWATELNWNSITTDPGFFHLLVLPLLFCWVVLLDFLFPHGSKMVVIVLLNNSNPKLPEKKYIFSVGCLFYQPRKTFPRTSSAKLVSCLIGQNCIRRLFLKHSLAGGTEIATIDFSSVQSLSRVWLFATPWIAAR